LYDTARTRRKVWNYVRTEPINERLCMAWECWIQNKLKRKALSKAQQLELTVTLAAAENELYVTKWERACVHTVLRKVRASRNHLVSNVLCVATHGATEAWEV
jgi:hypothetical protein